MTAFESGYESFLKGKGKESNPFNPDTCPNSLKRWNEGWSKAQREKRS